MEDRFDDLCRALASPMSRRKALKLAATTLVGAGLTLLSTRRADANSLISLGALGGVAAFSSLHCPLGTVDVGGDICCPTDRTQLCGPNGFCCSPDVDCCTPPGRFGLGNGCCPLSRPQCCAGQPFARPNTCCPSKFECCDACCCDTSAGDTCMADINPAKPPHCCPTGFQGALCNGICCAGPCGNLGFCPAGTGYARPTC